MGRGPSAVASLQEILRKLWQNADILWATAFKCTSHETGVNLS